VLIDGSHIGELVWADRDIAVVNGPGDHPPRLLVMRSIKRALAASVSRRSRAAKLRWLTHQIEPGSTVLIVGASIPRADDLGIDNIVERGLNDFTDATVLTYDAGDPLVGSEVVRGDGCALPFRDDSFDYVFSNAVIEHVGGPERARRMLAESVRVARKGAIHTTPNRWFPVEVHTQLPLLHWLPRRWQHAAFARAGRPYWNTTAFWLFGKRDFAALDRAFRVERFSWITLTATWRP
jgi:hypothetical protein